jgi:hypothetical protein
MIGKRQYEDSCGMTQGLKFVGDRWALHVVRELLPGPKRFASLRSDLPGISSIVPRIARRGIESSARLGRHRWVVERTPAWLRRFRRLIIRYERRAALHRAFLSLGRALICWNDVQARLCLAL